MFSTEITYTHTFGWSRVNWITNDHSNSFQETYEVAAWTNAHMVSSIIFWSLISTHDKLLSINSGVGIPLDSYLKKKTICAGHVLNVSIPCNEVSANCTLQIVPCKNDNALLHTDNC